MKHIRKYMTSGAGFRAMGMVMIFSMVMDARAGDMAATAGASVQLDEYQLVSGPTVIEGVTENASGITYDKSRDALWIVLNNPTQLVELDRSTLARKRTVGLAGFDDTEDVVKLSSNKFAVVEERKQNLVLFALTNNAVSVAKKKGKSFKIDPLPSDNNLGLEGLTYDPTHGFFYMVKEKSPAIIHQVKVAAKTDPVITQPWNLDANNFGMTDFAAIHYHAGSGHLILLSDETKEVVEVTTTGTEMSRLSLKEGNAGIVQRPPQPEGVTMDDHDRLYVCSEPNLLYVFEKR